MFLIIIKRLHVTRSLENGCVLTQERITNEMEDQAVLEGLPLGNENL